MLFVFQVLSFFTARLDHTDKNLSVEQVKEVIEQGIRQFRKDRLKVRGPHSAI